MVSEFDCEGCGVHVYSFGTSQIPKSHMCGTCEWMNEFVPDPEEMMKLRKEHFPEDYNVAAKRTDQR